MGDAEARERFARARLADQSMAPHRLASHRAHLRDSRHYGWPGKSRVGYNACFATWLVIQHAPVESQKKYISLFTEASKQGELPGEMVAMMHDRIMMWEGKPQKYGSQITRDDAGKDSVYTLEDASKVNQWRAELGMEPLEDYAKRFGATWRP